MISVIIPAHNEGAYITSCLASILSSEDPGGTVQVIVAANGCRDDTVAKAEKMVPAINDRGWRLDILDLPAIGKIGALNAGDAAAQFATRAYIDADIEVSASLIRQLVTVLDRDSAVYASGRVNIPPARSLVSEYYGRFWLQLPFVADGVPGCGVFAVNAAGRARWRTFPDIISDDTFARYHFSPDEMIAVDAEYTWPVTEGFANLVRVRRRQDEGLEEIRRLYPDLAAKMPSSKPKPGQALTLFLQDPVGFVVYAAVVAAVRLPVFRNRGRWDHGR